MDARILKSARPAATGPAWTGSAGLLSRIDTEPALRLDDLERFYQAAMEAARGPTAEDRPEEAIAASRGVVQEDNESLMAAPARTLGIATHELQSELWEQPAGAPR